MSKPTIQLVEPYGGTLINLFVPAEEREAQTIHAKGLPFLQITPRTLCDLELLATGAMSPLGQFMGEADYLSVLKTMRLASGLLFPVPITLPAPRGEFEVGQEIALRDGTNQVLAVLSITEIYDYDPKAEQAAVLGTTDPNHPLVAEMGGWDPVYLAGPLRVLGLPKRFDFPDLYLTPTETRAQLAELGNPNVVAFQTRHPIHRVHEELIRRAMESTNGVILLHPAVGLTRAGDFDHFTRVRTYKAIAPQFPANRALLSLFPVAMRFAGPREAVWHALMRRNYGANAFIVGRDHAGAGTDSSGRPFYEAEAASDLVAQLSGELGIQVVPFKELAYVPSEDRFESIDQIANVPSISISAREIRDDYLASGRPLPAWHTAPEVAAILSDSYPPKYRQGFCVWFTGLPSSGKSTVANVLSILLQEHGRTTALLDGDIVRTHLSKGLGFSREDRDTNIVRIGFVGSEIARAGGAVLVAAVSPYEMTRNQVRHFFPGDAFIEVFVNTPLSVCEERDVKGLYMKARRGEAHGVTGVDDPYEVPPDAEVVLDTVNSSPEANAGRILEILIQRGYVRPLP